MIECIFFFVSINIINIDIFIIQINQLCAYVMSIMRLLHYQCTMNYKYISTIVVICGILHIH